jgi:hypothetical protein
MNEHGDLFQKKIYAEDAENGTRIAEEDKSNYDYSSSLVSLTETAVFSVSPWCVLFKDGLAWTS